MMNKHTRPLVRDLGAMTKSVKVVVLTNQHLTFNKYLADLSDAGEYSDKDLVTSLFKLLTEVIITYHIITGKGFYGSALGESISGYLFEELQNARDTGRLKYMSITAELVLDLTESGRVSGLVDILGPLGEASSVLDIEWVMHDNYTSIQVFLG